MVVLFENYSKKAVYTLLRPRFFSGIARTFVPMAIYLPLRGRWLPVGQTEREIVGAAIGRPI